MDTRFHLHRAIVGHARTETIRIESLILVPSMYFRQYITGHDILQLSYPTVETMTESEPRDGTMLIWKRSSPYHWRGISLRGRNAQENRDTGRYQS